MNAIPRDDVRVGRRPAREESGSQSLEWIGIGAVAVTLAAAVIGFVPEIGEAIAAAFNTLIEQLLQGG